MPSQPDHRMSPSRPAHALAAGFFARPLRALRISVAAALLLAVPASAGSLPAFKLFVEAPGPYRVSFEQLAAAGLEEGLPSAGLGLFHDGHPAPLWVEDGGDGVFGPGDSVELIGEAPHGWVSEVDEHTRYNVYFLRFDAAEPLRMTDYRPEPVDPAEAGEHRTLRRVRHYEYGFLVHDLPPQDGRPEERWYWARLSHSDPEPFAHTLDLGDLAFDAGGTVDLSIEMRGLPAPGPDPETPDHRVEVTLNGAGIATAQWDGTGSYLLEVPGIAIDRFAPGNNDLRLQVPGRTAGDAGEPLIDTVLLNWIEVAYPRLLMTGGPPADFELADPEAAAPMRLLTQPQTELVLYGRDGSRMTSAAVEPQTQDGWAARVFYPAAGETSFVAVSPGGQLAPAAIARERGSRLRDAANRADYIMIAHRRLLAATWPLAAYHRARGLLVEVVDVQDVYDEFSGGMARPWALRDFLAYAYHTWQRPAPRFVLLVGDAGWNGKDLAAGDGSFPDRIAGEEEAPALANHNLIPTWSHAADSGHAASDNRFAAVGGDELPVMAIGRLPAVEPAEVAAVVDKTIPYMLDPEVGPWRRDVLFLTDGSERFRRQSRWVAGYASAAGLAAREIHPGAGEQARLIESLNQGQLLVHYLGEDGRQLIDLEQVANLGPNRRLPVVLSLTGFTAAFDHPADSLGEKLLRAPGRGAVAVLAASGGHQPSGTWGQILIEELTNKGATVGEAVMRAKRAIGDPAFVAGYNLLGDPALPVARPATEIALSLAGSDSRPLTVTGTLATSAFTGELTVELVAEDFETLASTTRRLEGFEFAAGVELPAAGLDAVRFVRAYAWDASRGIDAAGAVELADEPRKPPAVPRFELPAASFGEADDSGPASAGELLADAVAWWSFDSGAVHDRLGTHHGSLVGHAGRAASPRADAMAFRGRGFVDFGGDPRLDLGTGDFALQVWIRTREARDRVWVILDKRSGAGYHLFNYRGRLGLQLAGGEFTNYEGPFVADGDWHHVVVSVDRDRGDGIRWFVDGREAAPRQDPRPHQGSLDSPAPLTAGGRHHGGGHFIGDLDELAVFRRALTAGDVERLHQAGLDALRE